MARTSTLVNFRVIVSIWLLFLLNILSLTRAWVMPVTRENCRACYTTTWQSPFTATRLLSDAYLENDLVAVAMPSDQEATARLCAVHHDGSVSPLCIHEDDVETDLFVDPREYSSTFWTDEVTDEYVKGTYGEGFFGQRPVPSLGGGPGYGAEADPVWSVDEEILEKVRQDGVFLPTLDMGIAHGEKARAGAF